MYIYIYVYTNMYIYIYISIYIYIDGCIRTYTYIYIYIYIYMHIYNSLNESQQGSHTERQGRRKQNEAKQAPGRRHAVESNKNVSSGMANWTARRRHAVAAATYRPAVT